MELERGGGGEHGGDILIITHQAVLRCIVAYFMGKERSESPWMNVRIPFARRQPRDPTPKPFLPGQGTRSSLLRTPYILIMLIVR